jgi:putative endonuclease
MSRSYYVYIMTNANRTVLYTGVTNDLPRRVAEHKSGSLPGFTRKYNATLLVYFEEFRDVRQAIAREKHIKGASRKKKETLIAGLNPEWKDLADENSAAH